MLLGSWAALALVAVAEPTETLRAPAVRDADVVQGLQASEGPLPVRSGYNP